MADQWKSGEPERDGEVSSPIETDEVRGRADEEADEFEDEEDLDEEEDDEESTTF